jgi:hypothetical protein
MRYATLWRKKVVNVHEGPAPADPAAVEAPAGCAPGWGFDGSAWSPGAPRTWTALAFLLRLTAAEREAIRQASAVSVELRDFLMLAQAAQEVTEADPLFRAGVDALDASGLLAPGRIAEVLA